MRQLLLVIALLLGLFQVTALKRGPGKPRQRGEGARSFFIEYLDVDDLATFRALGAGNISAGIRLCAKIAKSSVLLVCPAHSEQVSRATYADLYASGGYLACDVCGSRLIDRAALEVIDARVGAVTSARQDSTDAPRQDAGDYSQVSTDAGPRDAPRETDLRAVNLPKVTRRTKKTEGANKMKTQNKYAVYENGEYVKTVTSATAKNAIRKVENERKSYLFNPEAINTQDAQDRYPLPKG